MTSTLIHACRCTLSPCVCGEGYASLDREYGRELRAMRHAFLREYGHAPTRVVWSHDIENAVIEQERRSYAAAKAEGRPIMELDIKPEDRGLWMRFIAVEGPPGTFYVDDKEGDAP